MPKVLIGADVGGTKTAVAVSRDGKIVGRADGPGAAVRPGRALASSSTIAEVVRQALSAAGLLLGDVLVVGAAGVGREPEREELRKALRGENVASSVVVTTDIEIALTAAFADGPGIVVSAGTGSVAVGRDRTGKRHRIGGYGWQMGDEGSGYAIGRASLGAVSRAVDDRSPKTALSDRLPAKPASDWSKDTLKVDCAGHFKLCYELKAGKYEDPKATDCSLTKLCVESDGASCGLLAVILINEAQDVDKARETALSALKG